MYLNLDLITMQA